jgi:hypothetical protein
MDDKSQSHVDALQTLISCLSPLDEEARVRLLKTIVTFLDIKGVRIAGAGEVRISDFIAPHQPPRTGADFSSSSSSAFSNRPDISAKEFLLGKEPKTDVERVACLAFYLTHYRNVPHFKTLDISTLNTEAAQVKFSNAGVAVENATKLGFLVPAVKGTKQIGAIGEKFVNALPDREAAKAIRDKIRVRRTKKPGKTEQGVEII